MSRPGRVGNGRLSRTRHFNMAFILTKETGGYLQSAAWAGTEISAHDRNSASPILGTQTSCDVGLYVKHYDDTDYTGAMPPFPHPPYDNAISLPVDGDASLPNNGAIIDYLSGTAFSGFTYEVFLHGANAAVTYDHNWDQVSGSFIANSGWMKAGSYTQVHSSLDNYVEFNRSSSPDVSPTYSIKLKSSDGQVADITPPSLTASYFTNISFDSRTLFGNNAGFVVYIEMLGIPSSIAPFLWNDGETQFQGTVLRVALQTD